MANTLRGSRPGRSGGTRIVDGRRFLDFTEIYRVHSDTVTTIDDILENTAGLPADKELKDAGVFGDAMCISRRPKMVKGNRTIWDVVTEWTTEPQRTTEDDGGGGGGDPTGWIPLITTTHEIEERIVTEDSVGNKAINTAGYPYGTGIVAKVPIRIWDFVQYESPSTTQAQIDARNGIINDDDYNGSPRDTLQCFVTSSELGVVFGHYLWKITYRVKYNPLTWLDKRLSVGPYYIDIFGATQDFLTSKGVPYIGPLNEVGGIEEDAENVHIQEFVPHPGRASFSFLRV